MLTSVYLARLIGPVLLAAGIGLLVNRTLYDDVVRAYLADRIWTFYAGLAGLTAGLAIVLAHRVVAPDWRLLITLLGWLMVIDGAARLIVPDAMRALDKAWADRPFLRPVGIAATILVGAVLTIAGYWPQTPTP